MVNTFGRTCTFAICGVEEGAGVAVAQSCVRTFLRFLGVTAQLATFVTVGVVADKRFFGTHRGLVSCLGRVKHGGKLCKLSVTVYIESAYSLGGSLQGGGIA